MRFPSRCAVDQRQPGRIGINPNYWIFAEDRFAVEAEQAAHDAQGSDWNQEILPFLFDLRDLLAEFGVPIEAAAT